MDTGRNETSECNPQSNLERQYVWTGHILEKGRKLIERDAKMGIEK
jgi:hypothetical protein